MPAEWDSDVVTYGAKGAKTGALIGTASPLGPGLGTAIGAGVGFLAGGAYGLFQEDSEYEKLLAEQLEELKRRQEMGALGLTSEEQAALERQYLDPIQAARRETGEQFKMAVGQEMDPAALAKKAIGQEQRAAEAETGARAKIAAEDVAEKKREEQQIMEMMATQEDIERYEEQQMWDSLEGAAGAMLQGSKLAGQLSELNEVELGEIAADMNMSVEDLREFQEQAKQYNELLSRYGG